MLNLEQKLAIITKNQHRLSTKLGEIELKNLIMPASGCCGFGQELSQLYPLEYLGAICIKSTTDVPYLGNNPHRIYETASGMLNAIGLQNPGVEVVINEYLPQLENQNATVIVNVAGSDIESYLYTIEQLNAVESIVAIELNVSCPNVKVGGIAFGTDEKVLENLVSQVVQLSNHPIYVKLSPNVADIKKMALAAEKAGASGLSMINTLVGAAIDWRTGKFILDNKFGGLSGPAIKPVALKQIYEVRTVSNLPIIGMGGITTATDLIEFLSVGADACAIGSENFNNPLICIDILVDLITIMDNENIQHINEFKGRAHA